MDVEIENPFTSLRRVTFKEVKLAVAQARQGQGEVVSPLVEAVRAALSERPRLAAAVAGTACAYAVWRAVRKPLARKWRDIQHAIHGTVPFEGESMQEGSDLDASGEAEAPPCQVSLYAKGLFTTTFLGCGARLQSYLVTPWHVVRGCSTIIAENPATGVRMEVPARMIRSKAIQDLCYYQCSDAWWSQMGTRSANCKTLPETLAMRSTPAYIVSRVGASTGSVQPLPLNMYKVSYTGSTVPGFSGALYVANNRILGMHQGTQGSRNIGFLWEAIITDAKYLFNDVTVSGEGGKWKKGKASGPGLYPLADGQASIETPASNRMWGYGDVYSQISKAYEVVDSSWSEDVEVDYDAQLQFESGRKVDGVVQDMCSNMAELPLAHLEAIIARAQAEMLRKNTVVGHNETGATVDGGSTLFGQALATAKETAKVLIEERVRPLEARVAALETSTQARPPAQPAKPKPAKDDGKVVPCPKCEKKFYTPQGLQQHLQMTMHGEGRKPAPFLGMRKPQGSSKNLQQSSTTSEKGSRLLQRRVSPQSSSGTPNQFEGTLEKILEAINGLKQGLEQSSKA